MINELSMYLNKCFECVYLQNKTTELLLNLKMLI